MKTGEMFDFYKKIDELNILLLFKGALSQETLIEMGESINNQGSEYKKEIRISFAVFIELAQNIMNYSAERELINGKDVGVGICVFREATDGYHVISGNRIKKEISKSISDKLDIINAADADLLKQMYKEQRKNTRQNTNSAGLGLMDIARKSGSNIEYYITDIDDATSFLEMNIKITKGNIDG